MRNQGTALGMLTAAALFMGAGETMAQSSQTVDESSQQNSKVEEVIVTAERRSERLTDVPMTVSVLSGEQLEQRGVTDTTGLQQMTGGLQLPFYGVFVSPSIRGVSTEVIDAGVASNVAFYLDGVYQPSQIGQLMSLPDIQEIEILKGPQGTLYGQNAEGGAIVINTLSPSFEPTGSISVGYGNYNDVQLRGYVAGPIMGETLAGSLSGSWEQHDGFTRGIIGDQPDPGLQDGLLRGKLLFQPSDAVKITLTAYYTSRRGASPATGQLFEGLGVATKLDPAVVAVSSPWQNSTEPNRPTYQRTYGLNLRGQFDVHAGELDVISSYSNTEALVDLDVDYSPINIAAAISPESQHVFEQSIDFVSKKFWVATITAGLYYQNSYDLLVPNTFLVFDSGLGLPMTVYPTPPSVTFTALYASQPTTNEFYAAYSEINYDVTSNLVVSAGGRVTKQTMQGGFSPDVTVTPPTDLVHSPASWTNFSPRATARYKLTDDSNIYLSYSQGFKAGLLNTSDPASLPVKPETLTAYEVGYKGVPLDKVSINLSGFWYDYKDKQVAEYIPPANPIQNASRARMKGIDLDVAFAVTPYFTLDGNGEYLDARYTDFPNAAVYLPDPATGGLMNATMNVTGHPLDRAPEFTGTISADYHVNTDIGRFNVNASVYYSSKTLWDSNGLVFQNPYSLVDIEMGFEPEVLNGVRLVAYGTNLTNTAHLAGSIETTFAAGVSYAPPRQFGIRVEYQF